MLMQPTSPDPKFDFMLKNNPQSRRGLGLSGLSKPLKIGLGITLGIILLVIISSVLSGRKNGSIQPLLGVVARNHEILRVNQLTKSKLPLQDPETKAVAATVYSSLTSEQQQLTAYLAATHIKLTKAQLAADTNTNTDAQLQDASQNNDLDTAYKSYLKEALNKYAADLQAAYKAVGPNGKVIMKNAFESVTALLQTGPLKS
jgi:hypothetical protein